MHGSTITGQFLYTMREGVVYFSDMMHQFVIGAADTVWFN